MAERHEPRKRGRPPLLKEYADPMKSPMAFSSMQVQKAGAGKKFTKPWMKVSLPGSSPSPKKRRTSSVNGVSPLSSSPIGPKRSRQRSVALATPVKQQHQQRPLPSSSPLTPTDSVFSSEPRRPARSSPIEPIGHLSETPPRSAKKPGSMFTPGFAKKHFKFSLCIDDDGKAKIAGSSTASTQTSEVPPVNGQKPPLNGFDKSVVLGLLKKMKSNRRDLGTANKTSVIRPSEVFSDFQPMSPKQSSITQPSLPWTPNCTSVFQLKTGFTPNNAIDEVLDTKQPESHSSRISRSPSNAAVFKFSSGDPLLMTDDPNTEFYGSHNHHALTAEHFFQQLLSSPRKPLTYFNSPPSLLSTGSFKTIASKDNHNRAPENHSSGEASRSTRGKNNLPTTPIPEYSNEFSVSAQCTPLIQQTMSGSLCKLMSDSMNNSVPHTAQAPKVLEHDDARLALRKLIGGSN
ncbi:LADA_0A01486g1_1 [Lachancea dasiensis]|uniref:LADA_0A01486g1_1 n=1 Tax=Lachancea dasiensis TaxID=1072105 RepID=A0A1G4IM71_9SACH|nr:LADA_0A01486g1_1 [Lachancea dasiensis]